MKPDFTICSVMVILFTGFIIQIISAGKEMFSPAKGMQEEWVKTNATDMAALDKLAKGVIFTTMTL